MFGLFARRANAGPALPRLKIEHWNGYLYAIGDVHGCLAELRQLEQAIAADCARHGERAMVACVGDYVDRGPHSAGVIDYLLADHDLPFERICLTGNHEQMLLDFIAAPRPDDSWLGHGGEETLRSYGLSPDSLFEGGRKQAQLRLASYIPSDHLDFLRSLSLSLELPGIAVVHAGLRPGLAMDRQTAQDMLWMRPAENAYQAEQPFGLLIHGHTPAIEPVIETHRICIDTAAFATGKLTAVRIAPDGSKTFLSTR